MNIFVLSISKSTQIGLQVLNDQHNKMKSSRSVWITGTIAGDFSISIQFGAGNGVQLVPSYTQKVHRLEFFTNSPQYKNAKISNLVLALPLKIN